MPLNSDPGSRLLEERTSHNEEMPILPSKSPNPALYPLLLMASIVKSWQHDVLPLMEYP